MRFGATVAAERAIEQHDWPGLTAAGPRVPDVITSYGAAVEQDLAGVGGKLRRLRRAFMAGLSNDGDARSVIRRPLTATLFIVSSIMTSRTQQSSPFNLSAVKWG